MLFEDRHSSASLSVSLSRFTYVYWQESAVQAMFVQLYEINITECTFINFNYFLKYISILKTVLKILYYIILQ